jgi:hypothetical protein
VFCLAATCQPKEIGKQLDTEKDTVVPKGFEPDADTDTSSIEAYTGTPGLKFELINDGTEYAVSAGFVKSGDVVVPAYYQDKPVTSIYDFGSTDITSITIPASVTDLSWNIFSGCSKLANIIIDKENTHFVSEGGALFNKAKTKLIAFPTASGAVTIPATVTVIGSDAFLGTTISDIIIPPNVTSIEHSAFWACRNLTSITIPASVKSIDNHAFFLCENLVTVNFENGSRLQKIENYTFSYCISLSNINIPESVTSIGVGAFRNTGLTNITIPANVTHIGDGAFFRSDREWINLTVPKVMVVSMSVFMDNTAE